MSKKGKAGLGVLVTGVIVAGVIVGLNIAPKNFSAEKKTSSTGNKASTDDTSGTQGNRRPGNGESGSMGAFCLGDEDGTSCRNPCGNCEKTEGQCGDNRYRPGT